MLIKNYTMGTITFLMKVKNTNIPLKVNTIHVFLIEVMWCCPPKLHFWVTKSILWCDNFFNLLPTWIFHLCQSNAPKGPFVLHNILVLGVNTWNHIKVNNNYQLNWMVIWWKCMCRSKSISMEANVFRYYWAI